MPEDQLMQTLEVMKKGDPDGKFYGKYCYVVF